MSGKADAWGPRWMLLILIGLLATVVLVLAWASRHPQVFNYPVVVTEASAQGVYREGERLMVWVSAGVVLQYAGTAVSTVGWSGTPLVLAGFLALAAAIAVGIARVLSAARLSA